MRELERVLRCAELGASRDETTDRVVRAEHAVVLDDVAGEFVADGGRVDVDVGLTPPDRNRARYGCRAG
ncbi:hypothetical protein ACWKWP_07125 [Agromyces soli]